MGVAPDGGARAVRRLTRIEEYLTVATRAAFQRDYQACLRVWDASLKQWKAKTFNTKAAQRDVFEGELKNLSAQRALAQRRFDELVKHEEDAWEPLQELAAEAWVQLRKATEQAGSVFGPFPNTEKS
jgi:hypothetical protein